MTARDSGKGVAGSGMSAVCRAMIALRRVLKLRPPDFTHYNYPGIYKDEDFHHCGLEPNDAIVNWDNEAEVWMCELDGLAECV